MNGKLVRQLVRTIRPSPRADLEGIVRWLVSRKATRRWLNVAYNRLSAAQKEAFYSSFAKIFRGHPQRVAAGEWKVDVGGKWMTLPLDGDEAWLEWDLAVSLLGHELEIKHTYLEMIRFRRPRLFFDIGASYGLHSALFLLHGIPAVSFEPNVKCHGYLRKLAERNGFEVELQEVALGATESWVSIAFPERDTWLGSTNPVVIDQMAREHGGRLETVRVPQTTLDTFVRRDGRLPDLIKVDAEGNEAAILEGARETLTRSRPWVIFESWREAERAGLLAFFEGLGYQICALPLAHSRPPMRLDEVRLRKWPGTNMIALPMLDRESGFHF